MLETLIGVVLGAVLSILVTIWVENLRRPRLRIAIEPAVTGTFGSITGGLQQPMPYHSLTVRVSNKQPPTLAGWIERGAALGCRGTISFHRFADGQNLFGNAMAARWATGVQPSPIPIVNITNNQIEHFMLDDQRIAGGSIMDIHPGESELLDIVVRFNTDQDCYGWNNETYFLQPPAQPGRNPKWQLGYGRFLVKIVVRSSGHTCVAVFQLINDVPVTSFRLEMANRLDRAKVR